MNLSIRKRVSLIVGACVLATVCLFGCSNPEPISGPTTPPPTNSTGAGGAGADAGNAPPKAGGLIDTSVQPAPPGVKTGTVGGAAGK